MSIERERNNQLIQGLGPKAYACTNTYVHTYIWTRIFLFTNQTCFNRHLHIQAIKFSSCTHMNFTRLHFHPREHVSILILAEEIRIYREPRYRFSDLSAPVSITVKSPVFFSTACLDGEQFPNSLLLHYPAPPNNFNTHTNTGASLYWKTLWNSYKAETQINQLSDSYPSGNGCLHNDF